MPDKIVIKTIAPKREPIDLGKWSLAIKRAESVDYPDRSYLHNLYKNLVLDDQYITVWQKRELNILNRKLAFGDQGKENELINHLIDSGFMRKLLKLMISHVPHGYTLLWLDISMPGKQKPEVDLLDRRHVVPEKRIIKYQQHDINGLNYTETPLYNYVLEVSEPDNMGKLMEAAPHIIYKRNNTADWATLNEIFGQPLKKGTYPIHDKEAKEELENTFENQTSGTSIVHPEGTNVEIISSNIGDSKGSLKEFETARENSIAKIFLGNTLTTSDKGGQYKADVHKEEQDEIFKADDQEILTLLNGRFKELLEIHGYKPGKGTFSFVDETLLSPKERLERDKELNGIIDIDAEYFYDTYDIPVPKGGAKKAGKKEQATKAPKAKPQGKSNTKGNNIEENARNFYDTLKGFFA